MTSKLEIVWILTHPRCVGFIGGHHTTFKDACWAAESHNKDKARSDYYYPKPVVLLQDGRTVPVETLAACPMVVVHHSDAMKVRLKKQTEEIADFNDTVKKILEGGEE